MNFQEFSKNRYFKLILALILLYLILIHNGHKKNNVLDNFSFKVVTDKINEIKDNTEEFSNKVKEIKEIQHRSTLVNSLDNIVFDEVSQGQYGNAIKCFDDVEVVYRYYDKDTQKTLDYSEIFQINMAEKYSDTTKILMQKAIIGKKTGAVIRAELTGVYGDADKKINDLLKSNLNKLTIDIFVVSVIKSDATKEKNNYNCN